MIRHNPGAPMSDESPPPTTPRARTRRTLHGPAIALAALAPLVAAGCYTPILRQCPTCVVVSKDRPPAPLPPGTRIEFLIVPGQLGFGWEWDEPLERLRRVPGAAIETFDWRPSSSARTGAAQLAQAANARLADSHDLEQLVIIGHSAAGLVTSIASSELRVPPGKSVLIANVGSPYAGMHTMPFEEPHDAWSTPMVFSIAGTFSRYPSPAPGVTVESWVTPESTDPVMKSRFGHHPGDPKVGPPGVRHVAPPGTDHNRFLVHVIDELASRVSASADSRPASMPLTPAQ
jgi:hypothetical protein